MVLRTRGNRFTHVVALIKINKSRFLLQTLLDNLSLRAYNHTVMNRLKYIWTKGLLYSVFIIYFISVFLIISGLYLYFTKQKSLTETILILTGVITAISVVYLAEQIRVASEQEKVKRSYEYLARYNSEDFEKTIKDACNFIRDGRITKDEKMDIVSNRKNPKYKTTRSTISLYFNFFEEMAILYNRNLLNKDLIRSFFKSITLSTYNDGKDIIDRLRKEGSKTFFKEWEKMNKDLENKKITGEK